EVLFRHVRLILGMAGICLSLALFIVFLITPQYTASSQILLEPRKQNLLGPEAITSDAVSSAEVVDGQIAIIKSRALLTRVVEEEKPGFKPGLGAEPPPSLIAQIKSLMPWAPASDSDSGAPNSLTAEQEQLARGIRRAVGVLQSQLGVSRAGRSNVLE